MKQFKGLLLFLILFLTYFSFGQKNIQVITKLKNEFDSLSNIGDLKTGNIIIQKAFKLIESTDIQNLAIFNLLAANYLETTTAGNDSCKKAYEKALIFARKAKNNENIIECLGHLIDYNYGQTAEHKKHRLEIGNELLLRYKNSSLDIEMAKIMAHLELYYKAEGNDNEALNSALKSLEIYKKLFAQRKVESDELAQSYYYVSRAYRNMDQPEKQNQYLKTMRKYILKSKDLEVIYYSFFARNLFANKEIVKAKLFNDSLLQVCEKYSNFNNWYYALEVNIYFTQGFSKQNDLKNAKTHLKIANDIYQKWKVENFDANINYTNGSVFLAEKNYSKALPFFIKASGLAKEKGFGDLYQYSLTKAATCLEKTGNFKEAYSYSQIAAIVADSLATISTENAFIETEAKFQNKEKQQEIEIKNLQIAQNNSQKKWYLTALGALLVALSLLFWNFQTKRKTNKIINDKNVVLEKVNTQLTEANQTKAKLFGIISHDLRSPISQVYQFLKLQELNPNILDEKQKADLSGKIQTATGSLLETMEDLLLWSKTQMNEFNVKIQSAEIEPIIDQCLQLMKLNIENKSIKIISKNIEKQALKTDPYFLQIIIRNLLQNAIKASPENSEIGIVFENNQLKISNKGALFTQKDYENVLSNTQKLENLSGLGLKLVDELSKKIGAKISFENEIDLTIVKILLP